IIDVKLITSYRVDEEEKIPAKTETVTVKETTKLPITGDSLILFAILGAIILIAIVVFIRMKKLAGKENK
ncbi:MAG: LPXTG cell wall anchor domain-containing protein, partial [Clostridia bacterium]|nr:LPXTG cell wall anchor domain-containing protein [Clostridia bacterium]